MSLRAFMLAGFSIICACITSGQPTKMTDTGIQGSVMVSPSRPGPIRAEADNHNAAALPNATFRVTSNEGVVATFTTDAQGHFQVTLKPGHYSALLAENRFPKPCGPFEIDVEAGKMTEVEWRCDTGMR